MKPRRTVITVLLLVLALAPLFSGSVQADQQPPREMAVPQAVTNTYTNNTPVNVPDGLGDCNGTPGAPATSTITVPDDRLILDLNVGLNISATWVGDVIVRLTTPDGTTVTLVDRPGRDVTGCGYSSDNIVTILDDASSGGLVEYGDPPTGPSYRPQEPLAFTGQNSAGTWTLTVIDAAAIAAVRLNSWSLIITGVVPPVAENDSASLDAGSAVAIPVTSNDTDSDGTINPATVRIGTTPTCGTAVPNGGGGVLYTNTDTTCTTDAFTYTVVDDDFLTSNAASVTITINRTPPVAVDDTGAVTAGGAVTVQVTANDTDADGTIDPATVAIVTAPTCGTAVPDGAGGVLYTNTNTTCTADTFTYTVQDDDSLISNAASVLVGIDNAPPVAVDDPVTIAAGGAVTVPVTANDTDIDGTIDPASVTIVTGPTCGTAVPDGAGSVVYTNVDTTCTTDTFTYTVQDDDGLASLPASVLIGIDAPPPPPPPPAPVVVELPPPPPAPLCNDMDFDEDAVVRAWVPDAYRHAVYCHLIAENENYLFWYGSPLTHAGQVGVPSVLERGVIHAVDVFSPTGLAWYDGGAVVCLRGAGKPWFMPAAGVPRSAEDMTEYNVEEFAGFTCTTLYMPGTLVLSR